MSAHAMFADFGSVNIALSVLDCLLFMQSLRSCLPESQSLSEKGFFGRRARVAQLDRFGANIIVMQECGPPAEPDEQCVYFKVATRQGVGVVTKGSWRTEAAPLNPLFRIPPILL